MTKKPFFWIAIVIASAMSFYFSWLFFAQAFPLLNVDVSISRAAVLEAATARAAALKLAPADARHAVRFSTDSEAQNFIELEAGGKSAFTALLNNDIYQALTWEVRLFREKDAASATLYYTPQGKPYGFTRHYPEQDPGAALSTIDARRIAETAAMHDWGVDLAPGKSPYTAVEQSFLKRASGRIDHSFVYERGDQRLGRNGEGRVRLTLVVAGDQLAQLRYSVRIPESFQRRFAEMRSANTTIASTAALAAGLLYFLGGCIAGLVLLTRQRYVVSRPAIKWAALVALLQAAMVLDQIPSAWFDYDTAVSANAFIGQQIVLALAAFFGMWLLLAISFIAAESLTRKAFGHHPQLWRLWSADAARTPQVLGRTLGGYLWVGFGLAFIVAFYSLTQRHLGWWSPIESLVDPNILATPMPWLTPVANALQAGMWEECLFRAVPLASAALIGDYLNTRFNGRFGARNTWLVIGLVVEALIFGAAHATYPQQPAYARPLELFMPAILWGVVYLRFGLLPGILFHFLFDLLLMSLPIFATSVSGLGPDRAMVILFGSLPLLVVLWSRLRGGAWHSLPQQFLNAAWHRPDAARPPAASVLQLAPDHATFARVRRALPILGAAGLIAWLVWTPFKQDVPPLYLERAQAESAADAARAQGGVTLSPEWKRFSQARDQSDGTEAAFVWREGGAGNYAKLMGSYLAPPTWNVRYARFEGDVAQRAEEWQVVIENGVDGKAGHRAAPHVRLVNHQIPESRAGSALSVEDARVIAQRTVRERFLLDPAALREISAIETRRPNRTDWHFTFVDDKNYPLKAGEARVEVNIAGNEVAYAVRTVHVPEEWQRSERARRALMRNVQVGIGVLAGLLVVAAFIIAIMRGAHGGLARRPFIVISAALFVLSALSIANSWQGVAMDLSTAEPLLSQLWLRGAALTFGALLLALASGLFAGLGAQAGMRGRVTALWLPGVGLGAALAGLAAGLGRLGPADLPHWDSVSLLSDSSPALGALIGGARAALQMLTLMTFLLVLLRDFNADFSKRRIPTVLILLLLGMVAALKAPTLSSFLIQGIGTGAVIVMLYLLVARFEPKIVLIALVTKLMLVQLQIAIVQPYPHAALFALLQASTLCATAFYWLRLLEREYEKTPSIPESMASAR